jgi:1,2-dihydroxy-3-keto-5-methylthiopentene dioxygenase
MTLLQIMPEDDSSQVLVRETDPAVIAGLLSEHGITLEQWPVVELPDGAGSDQVLATYQADVDRVSAEGGYRLVDVVALQPTGDPEWVETAAAARARFLDEHRHDEDEVRFFVAGRGCFYLRLDGRVHALVCEAGDLVSVPAGTRHWFDMGAIPRFCAIRFFQEEDGWVGNFTGDTISRRMPDLDQLLAPAQ